MTDNRVWETPRGREPHDAQLVAFSTHPVVCVHPGPSAGFREIRSGSHFPTRVSRPFPPNSYLLKLVGDF
jgi:hypothetical protein